MKILNLIVNQAYKLRINRINQLRFKPYELQERTFNYLIAAGKNTDWGKKYDYRSIKRYTDFQERVPISTYEDLYPYIERMLKGEDNVLWQSPVRCFAKSSGTTNARSKYIPVSREALKYCHYTSGQDMFAIYIDNRPDNKIFGGKIISISGSMHVNPFNKETQCGDVSAIIVKNLPIWVQLLRAPTLETALLDKWEEKIERIAQETIPECITGLSGVPTWTVVLLQRILEITGKSNISEVWPHLELFIHGAVSFSPYRQLFNQLVPSSRMQYLEVYNASEGYFAVQDDMSLAEQMLLLADNGVFYEFIPLEEINNAHPKAIPLWEVELNKNYALVITTNAGLWRYVIGDTVRFTSLLPCRIKITGRTKHFINAFGEEVVVENAEAAITSACHSTGAVISEYTAAPIYMNNESKGKGGHEWVVEFEREPDDFERFVHILDETLRQVNSDYDAKRYQDLALQKPVIHKVKKGTFYNWLKQKGRIGGQYKVPRLSNSREYIEDILSSVKAMF